MTIQVNPAPDQAEMTLMRHCPLVKCGQEVKRGERIATSSSPDKGDIHAPFSGNITHVDPYRIGIATTEGETVETTPLEVLRGEELRKALLQLGADLPKCDAVDNLIINSVDEEQGIITRSSLLDLHRETLAIGAQALVDAYKPVTATLTVLKGTSSDLISMPTVAISDQYPSALAPLVAKAVTGIEAPEDTVVIGLETVFQVGRIMQTELPVMETMITIGDEGVVVSLGTPVGEILSAAGETLQDRDRIVLGGSMRGTAAASPAQGIDRSTTAVTLLNSPNAITKDTACIGCGECVRHCPARLDPAMITSYSEFGMYDQAAAAHVDVCFECGLCGFFCVARRPMLQYIRLAKNELAQAAALSGEEK